ncbi:dihydrodipicolinate synthase family protein [Verrucomicrobiaceae bacterium 227]
MTSLKGIILPIITPLKDRDTLDVAGLERLLEHVIDGGVHGIFVLGTSGEAPNLSYRLRREMIERVCQITNHRIPVLAGISDTSFVESVHLAQHAAECRADALVLTTPYYFPAGQTELTDYVNHLVPELPLPVMLYNMPGLTKVWFELETLRKLSHHKSIIGLKDSSGNMDYFSDVLTLKKERPDWTFFVGPEHLLKDAMDLGADGGVNGGANVFPKLFADTWQAIHDDNAEAITSGMSQINAWQPAYDIGKYASRHIKAMKCALSLLGICDDFMAEPFHRFKSPEREKIATILNSLTPSS